jgi:hypothetical protein
MLIVSCDRLSSLKKVKSKYTLPIIELLSAVPASDTDVTSIAGALRLPCVTPLLVLDCWTIHATTSLLTNEVWAPVSNRVAAEYDGLSLAVMQHMRYVVSISCTSQSHEMCASDIMVGCIPFIFGVEADSGHLVSLLLVRESLGCLSCSGVNR